MWQTNAVALRAGEEAMLIDSPYFPDELEALPGLLAGAGFEPDALIATHADFDHVLGRLAFPGLALGLGEPSVGGSTRSPARRSASCATRTPSCTWSGRPLALGQVQALPVPGSVELGPEELELHPAEGHTPDGMAVMARWCGVLCVGDYLSNVEIPMVQAGARRLPLDARAPGAAGGGGGDDRARPRRRQTTARPRSASSTRTWTISTRWSAERSARSCRRAATRASSGTSTRRTWSVCPRGARASPTDAQDAHRRDRLVLLGARAAQAAPSLSTTNRLDDRRYVESGSRGYVVGSEAGRFPASGWHIRGEMGGVWTPPLKLLDGIWFGIDGKWIGPATRFTSGSGYAQMDLPGPKGLTVQRTDFVPDGRRAALFGLTLRSTSGRQRPVMRSTRTRS